MPVPGPGSETLTSVKTGSSIHLPVWIGLLVAEFRARKYVRSDLTKQTWIHTCVPGCTRSLSKPVLTVIRRIHRSRGWYFFFPVAFCEVTVLGTMTVTCTPQPLPKPGERGELPPVPPRDQKYRNAAGVIEIDLKGPPVRRLECGQGYDFEVVTSAYDVTCEGYDYSMLYGDAIQNMHARIADLECGPDCPRKHYYIRDQAGDCRDGLALVFLRVCVVCLAVDAPAEPGLAPRRETDLRAPFRDSLPGELPEWSESLSIEKRPKEHDAECPYDYRFWITLRATVGDCNAIDDYSPYVSHVQTRAAAIWHAIRCPELPCEKWPLKELGAVWGCKDGVVTVRYAFIVPCERN